MIPLREIRAARRDNAVYGLLAKRLRSPGQVAMLVVATAVAAGACWIVYPFVPPGADGLLIWFCIRWGVGELLWTWMAADHSFSEYRRAHDSGQLREWVLTRLPMRDIAAGFAHAGTASLFVAIVAWTLADTFAFPLLDGEQWNGTRMTMLLLYEALLAISHAQTASWTTWRCLAVASGYGPTTARWALTMLGFLGWHLGILVLCGVVLLLLRIGLVVASMGTSYPGPAPTSVSTTTVFVWLSVLVASLPVKHMLARRAREDAEKWFHCFIEKSVES